MLQLQDASHDLGAFRNQDIGSGSMDCVKTTVKGIPADSANAVAVEALPGAGRRALDTLKLIRGPVDGAPRRFSARAVQCLEFPLRHSLATRIPRKIVIIVAEIEIVELWKSTEKGAEERSWRNHRRPRLAVAAS